MNRPKVLFVDDDEGVLNACQQLLQRDPFEIITTTSSKEALQKVAEEVFCVLVADQRMPDMEGLQLLEKVREISPDTVRIVLTGHAELSFVLDAMNRGVVHRLLTKPWDDKELRIAIRQAVTQHENAMGRHRADAALRESQHQLKVILDAVDAGVLVVEQQTHQMLDVNPAAVRMIGKTREQIIGSICHQFVGSAEKGKCPVTDLKQMIDHSERRLLTASGKQIPIIKNVKPFLLDNRQCLIETFIDVSEQKRVELALKDSRERYQTLIDTVGDWIWKVDTQGVFTFSNSRVTAVIGYSLDELPEKTIFDLMSSEEAKRVKPIFETLVSQKKPVENFENTVLHKNGQSVTLEVNGQPFFSEEGRLMGFRGTCRDVTKTKQAQAKLRTAELLLAEERERQRIANHLHDRICQLLVAATMKLTVIMQAPGASTDRPSALRGARQLIEQAARGIRLLISPLRPPAVDRVDLKTLMEQLAREMRTLFGLRVRVRCNSRIQPVADEAKTVLYQCVRELLINVAKHARSDETVVSVQPAGRHIQVLVKDDGIGFDPAGVKPTDRENGGYGLPSIPERLSPLGGSFSIQSKPGHGAEATLMVPAKGKDPENG